MERYLRCLVVSFFFLLASFSVSADSIRQGAEDDIAMLLDAASGRNSAYWASYIGTALGRTYIVYDSALPTSSFLSSGGSHKVYWFPEGSISKEALAKFKKYKERRIPHGG